MALVVHQVVHEDVVTADVAVGVGQRLAESLVDLRRHAAVEVAGEARLGPLAARPPRPFGELLRQGGEREVEQRHEGDLGGVEVVADVGVGAPAGEAAVERQHRPEVEVGAAAQVAVERRHVAADALHGEFEALEGGVEEVAAGHELRRDERGEGVGVAVLGAPQPAHLLDAALDAPALRLAVSRHQRGDRGLGGGGVDGGGGRRGGTAAGGSPAAARAGVTAISSAPPRTSRADRERTWTGIGIPRGIGGMGT